MITSESSVRDVLKRNPSTRVTLDRHGLLGCGGREGPIGGLMMILFGMLSRILPVFEGVSLAHPRLLEFSFHALNIGALLRLAQVGAAYAWPDLMAVAGASGFFVLAGVIGMSFVVFGTIRRGRREAGSRSPTELAPGRVA